MLFRSWCRSWGKLALAKTFQFQLASSTSPPGWKWKGWTTLYGRLTVVPSTDAGMDAPRKATANSLRRINGDIYFLLFLLSRRCPIEGCGGVRGFTLVQVRGD